MLFIFLDGFGYIALHCIFGVSLAIIVLVWPRQERSISLAKTREDIKVAYVISSQTDQINLIVSNFM